MGGKTGLKDVIGVGPDLPEERKRVYLRLNRREGDIPACYGRGDASKKLSQRDKGPAGDEEHREKVEQERRITDERER